MLAHSGKRFAGIFVGLLVGFAGGTRLINFGGLNLAFWACWLLVAAQQLILGSHVTRWGNLIFTYGGWFSAGCCCSLID